MGNYTVHIRSGHGAADRTHLAGYSYNRLLREAMTTFGQVLQDMESGFWNDPSLSVWATDEAGETVLSLDAAGWKVSTTAVH